MGYFPNGTSNEIYTATYCANCRNWRHDESNDTYGCPIMDLHFVWNYDAVSKTEIGNVKHEALNGFIQVKGIENQECRMFLPSDPDRCKDTPDMFEPTP
jgi:hypothetical protein